MNRDERIGLAGPRPPTPAAAFLLATCEASDLALGASSHGLCGREAAQAEHAIQVDDGGEGQQTTRHLLAAIEWVFDQIHHRVGERVHLCARQTNHLTSR